MRPNNVKAMWKQGKPVAVGWVSSADTYVAEVMANAGFDALVLDMQHGMGIGPDRAATWLQAVSTTQTVPMVRVPWNEPVFIQWVLDAGAYGVIVPLVNNREEAAKAAGACRYPPLGYRSMGPNRARLYAGADYAQHANQEIACLVMVEDLRTVDQIDELAKAPGIDGFYIGPSDLALSMGLPAGAYRQDERHAAACRRVVDAAKAHGLVAGVHCGGAEEAVQRFSQGFKFCPIGSDVGMIAAGAAAALQTVRKAFPP
ncbi:MAG: 2,4-dihydroxyhept-2-ene-1,7-dioic acid aldolase [Dehalococcoidia bacterium]|nr:2,4-dihydroxyhept-2-ene-1,7-dioic acid aldolase [Dehalococcoidia bacterium]